MAQPHSIRRSLAFGLLALLTCVCIASAQIPAPRESRRGPVWGYGFAGAGARFDSQCENFDSETRQCLGQSWSDPRTIPYAGGGVEWQLSRRVGISAEGGALLSGGYFGGMFSANGSYFLTDARVGQSSAVPFITAGYSLDPDLANGVNLGAGVTWWGRGGTGLRLEMRSHFWEEVRFVEARIGISFGRRG